MIILCWAGVYRWHVPTTILIEKSSYRWIFYMERIWSENKMIIAALGMYENYLPTDLWRPRWPIRRVPADMWKNYTGMLVRLLPMCVAHIWTGVLKTTQCNWHRSFTSNVWAKTVFLTCYAVLIASIGHEKFIRSREDHKAHVAIVATQQLCWRKSRQPICGYDMPLLESLGRNDINVLNKLFLFKDALKGNG